MHRQPATLFFLCPSLSFLLMQIKHIACPRKKKGEINISVQDNFEQFLNYYRKQQQLLQEVLFLISSISSISRLSYLSVSISSASMFLFLSGGLILI